MQELRRKRLHLLIDQNYDGKQAAFISDTGINQGELSGLLSGKRTFGERKARKIEKLSRIDLMWLDQSDLAIPVFAPKRVADEYDIPQFDTGGSMGSGLILRDQPGVIKRLIVSNEWIQKNVRGILPKNIAVVTGFGDSMRPMFNSGDPLLIDTSVTTVEFDAVYFFRIGNEGFIKRLQHIPNEGLLVISENTKYKEWMITPDMDFQVFGRVLKVWRSEDY